MAMKNINKKKETLKTYYDDPKLGVTISINKDNKDNFMGFHCQFKKFKTLKYGSKTKNKLTFGNSGIENFIPYMMEVDLIGTWAPYLKFVKTVK